MSTSSSSVQERAASPPPTVPRNDWSKPITISKTVKIPSQPFVATDSSTSDQTRPVWKRGYSDYSVIYNLSRRQHLISVSEFYQSVKELLPFERFLGTRSYKDPNQGLLVEFSVKAEDDCQTLVQLTVQIGDHLLRPSCSLPPDSNVIQVHLTELPFADSASDSTKLTNLFSKFGQVLSLSLDVEKHSGIFADSGTIVLSIPVISTSIPVRSRPVKVYSPLTHEMEFEEFGIIRATWRNMPAYCRYCHKTDHFKKDCKSRPNNSCHTCGQIDHTNFRCEHGQRTVSRKKVKITPVETKSILKKPQQKTSSGSEKPMIVSFINNSVSRNTDPAPPSINQLPSSTNEVMEATQDSPEVTGPNPLSYTSTSDQSLGIPGLQDASEVQGKGTEDMNTDESPSPAPERTELTQEKLNHVSSTPSDVAHTTLTSTDKRSESTL
ncbi:hypothetical protein G6F23_004019 [Rhizopus arrhizus]|nr:hypothetical protein G6F23_004019 [Rhizopus arrhizus]